MSVSAEKETVKLENKTDFLDSLESKKTLFFNRFYTVLAFWAVLAPIMTTLFYSIGFKFELSMQWVVIAFLFGLAWFVQFSFNLTKLKFRKPDLFQILGYCLILLFFIVMFIWGVKQFDTLLVYSSYLLLFCLTLKLDKKFYKILIFVFIVEMTVDAILGVIDLDNKRIPGFFEDSYAFSMQFKNPNYAAYIVLSAIIGCIYYFINAKNRFDKILTAVCFVVLNLFLFINGSFVATTTLFIVEIVLIIFYWIKVKKFPLWLCFALLISLISSFFRIDGYSTCTTIYIFEVISLIDSYLGTNIYGFFIENFSGIENVIYGFSTTLGEQIVERENVIIWNREGIVLSAIDFCVAGFMPFVFGNGIGFANEVIRPHNLFLWWWVDFGIVFSILFYALCVTLIVMFAKSKNKDKIIFPFIIFCAYLFMYNFGVTDYSFVVFIVIFAGLYKALKEEKQKPID